MRKQISYNASLSMQKVSSVFSTSWCTDSVALYGSSTTSETLTLDVFEIIRNGTPQNRRTHSTKTCIPVVVFPSNNLVPSQRNQVLKMSKQTQEDEMVSKSMEPRIHLRTALCNMLILCFTFNASSDLVLYADKMRPPRKAYSASKKVVDAP